MKRIILSIIWLNVIFYCYGGCVISCEARYITKVYHPPILDEGYYEGRTFRVPIIGSGRNGYYENVWSNKYTLNVQFYSGFELNEVSGRFLFAENDMVAIIKWDNGGSSVVTINRWKSTIKYMNEKEVIYNNDTGQRIWKIDGTDKEGRYWEFYL